MASVPTPEELKKLKVVELKERLSKLELSTAGLKAELIGRLHNYYVQESLKQEEGESSPMEEESPDEEKEEDLPPVPVQVQLKTEVPDSPGPSRSVDEDLQRKVALQQQMLVVEHQQEQEKKLLEQQKEALALQARQQAAAAMMIQQPQHVAPPPPPAPVSVPPPPNIDLMEKVRQQQQMLEAEKHKQMMEQQQKMIQQQQQQQQQQQAISQAEAERRIKEAEIFRQQKFALMEAQREEQQMRMQKEQQRPPAHQMPVPPPGLPVMSHPQPPSTTIQQQPPQAPPPVQISTPLPPQMPPQISGPPPQVGPPQGLPQQAPAPPGMGPPPELMSLPPPPHGVPPPQNIGMMPPQGAPMQTGAPPPGIPPQQQSDSGMQQMMPPAQSMIPQQPAPPTVSEPHHEGPPPPLQPPMRPPPPQQSQMGMPLPPPPMLQQPPGPPTSMVQLSGPPQQQSGPPPPRPTGMLQGPPMSGPPPPGVVQTPPQEKLPSPQLEPPQLQPPKEIKLPHALEKILAFKDVRAQEVGLTPEEVETMHQPEEREEVDEMEGEEDEDVGYGTYDMDEEADKTEEVPIEKESKNKRRKKKKKKAKKNRLQQQQPVSENTRKDDSEEDVQIEYIQEQLDLEPSDPSYFTFAKIFEAFKISETEKYKEKKEEKVEEKKREEIPEPKGIFDEDDSDEDGEDKKVDDDAPKMSKKKLKKMTRLSVAQLKQLVSRPDVVEMHDVTAQDPRLLVQLKATRNTVPVPRHWCFKRKYLQGKRGIEKPPFELPEYIKATGIMEMREALAEKEDQKTLKAKMREKVRPKMGKIDIDYQKLHDAFFRWQTKPKMTIHGDLYYEGKEFETRLKEKKPGNLSDELRTALGMPVGPNADKFPPPWLIAMQRYGPPPSYPNLKIPGLNAPIPESTSFGYHAGGWGKPPVDENGKPLYGDVFGTQSGDFQVVVEEEEIDKSHWGELEEESSEEEDSDEDEEDEEDMTGLVTPGGEGLVTPSGITSVPMGVETPDMIELRKKRIEDAMDQGGETPALYTILPEKKSAVGGAMMGSSHIYDMAAGVPGSKKTDKVAPEGIEVALNPEELDLDSAAMQAKYDQTMREQQSQLEKEDLSDMVAEHAAKQKKRKKQQQDSGKAAKKYKEFKF